MNWKRKYVMSQNLYISNGKLIGYIRVMRYNQNITCTYGKNIFSDVTWHLVSQVSATAITVTPGSLVSCVSEKITHKTRNV